MINIGIFDLKKVLTRPTKICSPVTTTGTTPAEKFTEGIQNSITDISINDVSFPKGAYYVSIRPLAYNSPINVNGTDLYLTHEYNRSDRVNRVFCLQDFVPAVEIVANGNPYIITIAYPSNDPVNLATIGL